MKSKWNDEEQGRMLALRDQGKTYKEIAEEMGISYYSVSNFFHKQYIELHKQDPERYPFRKRGHPVTPDKSKKEPEREIRELKKELKLYKDFLHFSGRM